MIVVHFFFFLSAFTFFSLVSQPVAATFTSCFLYRDDVSDVSFTYNYNEARLAAHAMLLLQVQEDLRSNAYSDFDSTENVTRRFDSIIQVDGCNIIFITFALMLGDFDVVAYARAHPSVYFVERVAAEPVGRVTPSNYVSFLAAVYQNLFAVGALAATQTSSCVGVIYPRATQKWIPNAMQQGAIWAGSSTPIFSVMLGATQSAVDEIVITDLLLARGCNVILSVSDINVVPQYIASLQRDNVMGVGYGHDASLTAGDAILTSILLDMRYFFYNMSLYAMNKTALGNHIVLTRATELVLSDVSPRTAASMVGLATAVREFYSDNIVMCQPFSDQDGTRHTGCINNSQLTSYPYLDQRVHDMPQWRSPSTCAPGTKVEYNPLTFSLHCSPCPPNTFSNKYGAMNCTPCYAGLRSSGGSTECSAKSESAFSTLLIIPIVIGALLIASVAGLVAFALLRSTVEPTRDPKNAPKGPHVSFAMIGVDGARSDKQWRSSLSTMCDVYDRLAAVVGPIANKHRAYTFVSVGDVVMLASSSTQTLFDVLVEVHRSAWSVAWPCTIHLKLVLHEGSPTVVDGRRGTSGKDKRVVYSGRDVDLLRSLWRHEASYDMVISESAFDCLSIPHEHRVMDAESYVSPDLPLASLYRGVTIGGMESVSKVPIILQKHKRRHEVVSNPLDLRMTEGATDLQNSGSASGSTSGSELSEAVDDDLAQLVAPTNISKEELDALCSLGVDVLQKFLRVFTFDDQVNIVMGIAKRLHVQAPRIPAMKTAVKRSFNVLRNSLKQICNQLLLSMEGRELQAWLKAVAQHMDHRGAVDTHRD